MDSATATSSEKSGSTIPGSIFLVGMMGAGKTSVGRVLAKRLNKVFYDSDHVIEERTGVKIPVIFEIEGEPGFRQRESAVLDELTALHEVVLATGGGAVLAVENRERLRARGTVVYLRATVKDLLNRTRHDKNRPLLQTADPRARLNDLYEMRDPLYREVAHVTIDTGSQSLTTLVNRLHQVIETRFDRLTETDQSKCGP
ncbi:MAG TPA: shikimate kinase AroK, partial [Burkholderiales bacterium]|nr:shikimate kinase AroK [Burkholderiales bacterium]